MTITPFEDDIEAQPQALFDLLNAADPRPVLDDVVRGSWDRVVLTGMGSSHFAALPTWRSLVRIGVPAWWIDTGQLLDSPELLTPGTLLVVTSQSGASGEVVQLVDSVRNGREARGAILAVTADPASPLGEAAEFLLPLHSGSEATVSTKSYLNSLAVHRRIAGAFGGIPASDLRDEIARAARAVSRLLAQPDLATAVSGVAHEAVQDRLVAVGKADNGSGALYAALITKEAAKVPIEGFLGGQFRHGPYELAGPGLTAFLYGAAPADPSFERLALDLLASGSRVVLLGDLALEGAVTLDSPTVGLEGLASTAVLAQLLAVDLARRNHVVPGQFLFGSKVTSTV